MIGKKIIIAEGLDHDATRIRTVLPALLAAARLAEGPPQRTVEGNTGVQLGLGSASHRITGTIYGEHSDRSVLSTSQSRVQPGTIACVAAGVVVTK